LLTPFLHRGFPLPNAELTFGLFGDRWINLLFFKLALMCAALSNVLLEDEFSGLAPSGAAATDALSRGVVGACIDAIPAVPD
jgi:hypothetical protein